MGMNPYYGFFNDIFKNHPFVYCRSCNRRRSSSSSTSSSSSSRSSSSRQSVRSPSPIRSLPAPTVRETRHLSPSPIPTPLPAPPVRRYYGRQKSDSDSSLSDKDQPSPSKSAAANSSTSKYLIAFIDSNLIIAPSILLSGLQSHL